MLRRAGILDWRVCVSVLTLGQLVLSTGYGQDAPQYVLAVAVAAPDDIFLADRNLPGVWQRKGSELKLFFHGDKKFRTPLNAVRCLAIDRDGKLLAGDSSTRQVYRFNDGQPQPLSQPAGPNNVGAPGIPMGIALNSKNEIFVTDLEVHCIWKLPAAGGDPEMFAKVPAPIGIACDDQDRLWVVSRAEGPLRRYAADGTEEILVRGRPFEFPHGIALDAEGRAYVVDGYARTVWRVAEGQEPEKWFTHEKFVNPVDIKAHDGKLYVVDPRAGALFIIGPDAAAEVVVLKQ